MFSCLNPHADEQAKEFVRSLLPSLSAAGVRAWDDSTMQAGESWPEAIDTALHQVHAFVIVITSASASSARLAFELGVAEGRSSMGDLPIIPVLVGDARTGDIPCLLRTQTALDAREMPNMVIAQRIKEALSASTLQKVG